VSNTVVKLGAAKAGRIPPRKGAARVAVTRRLAPNRGRAPRRPFGDLVGYVVIERRPHIIAVPPYNSISTVRDSYEALNCIADGTPQDDWDRG